MKRFASGCNESEVKITVIDQYFLENEQGIHQINGAANSSRKHYRNNRDEINRRGRDRYRVGMNTETAEQSSTRLANRRVQHPNRIQRQRRTAHMFLSTSQVSDLL